MNKILTMLFVLCFSTIWAQADGSINIDGADTVEVGKSTSYKFKFTPSYPTDFDSGMPAANNFIITRWQVITNNNCATGGAVSGSISAPGANTTSCSYNYYGDTNPVTMSIVWSDGVNYTSDVVAINVWGHFYMDNTLIRSFSASNTKNVNIQRIITPIIGGPSPVESCQQGLVTYSISNNTNSDIRLWKVYNASGTELATAIVGSATGSSVSVQPPLTGNYTVKCAVKRSTASAAYSRTGSKAVTRSIFQSPAIITGSETICGYGTFSVTGLPAGQTFDHWSISPTGIASLSTTTLSTTNLTKVANGNVTLTAWIRNTCNELDAVTRDLVIGTRMAQIAGTYCATESAPCSLTNIANNGYLTLTLTAPIGSYIPPDADWQWEKISGNFYFNENGYYSSNTRGGKIANMYMTGANPTNTPIFFKVRVRNPCGWGDWRTYTWNDGTTTTTPPPASNGHFVISPNPSPTTGTQIIISMTNTNLQVPAGTVLNTALYSIPPINGPLKTGYIYFNGPGSASSGVLDVSGLASGSYIVQISIPNAQSESFTLIKQ